ncbi:MAG: hypothetical protein L0Y72_23180 [Gemmataceae bacterium]|nr:hypothetical protein [Gemmataceae bacterium]MCI0741947.1 hypothetical protein [Gemmataceae bacterium]
MRWNSFSLATALAIFVNYSGVQAEDRYSLIMFASQTAGGEARYSHTFATFVKYSADDGQQGAQNQEVQSRTISWLPATGVLAPLRLRPEAGVNNTLDQTIPWATRMGARVSAWGPFPIQKELYDLAEKRIALLESGAVAYKLYDAGFSTGVNCIQAVSDLVPGERLSTGTARGDQASLLVLRHFDRWIVPGETAPHWLVARLGLDQYPIQFRTLEPIGLKLR